MKLTPITRPVARWEHLVTSANIINGWKWVNPAVMIRIIREGDRVEMQIPALTLDASAATSDSFLALPPGFSTAGFGNYGTIGVIGAGNDQIATIRREYIGGVRYLASSSRSNTLSGVIFWRTIDPPPTT